MQQNSKGNLSQVQVINDAPIKSMDFLFAWLKNTLSIHDSYCYMLALIQYNNAMFHIFAGPLFASAQGYVYLDLLIWGISPLIFQFCRGYIKRQVTQLVLSGERKTLCIDIVSLWMLAVLGYLFMNYSPAFNWNYFSRVVNLQVGYLLYDFISRTLQLILEINREYSVSNSTLCKSHCQVANFGVFCSYLFILASCLRYDSTETYTDQYVLQECSLVGCVLMATIPFIYYNIKPTDTSKLIPQNDQVINQQKTTQSTELQMESIMLIEEIKNPKANRDCNYHQTITMGLLSLTVAINISYLSMWLLEHLKTDGKESLIVYNQTITNSSVYFLVSSAIYMAISQMHYAEYLHKHLYKIIYAFNALLLIYCFQISNLGKAQQNSLMQILNQPALLIACCIVLHGHNRFVHDLYSNGYPSDSFGILETSVETAVFLGLPLVITVCGISDLNLEIYAYLSGGCMLITAVLL